MHNLQNHTTDRQPHSVCLYATCSDNVGGHYVHVTKATSFNPFFLHLSFSLLPPPQLTTFTTMDRHGALLRVALKLNVSGAVMES